MSFLLSVLIAASSVSFWPITIEYGRQYGRRLASNANEQMEFSLSFGHTSVLKVTKTF